VLEVVLELAGFYSSSSWHEEERRKMFFELPLPAYPLFASQGEAMHPLIEKCWSRNSLGFAVFGFFQRWKRGRHEVFRNAMTSLLFTATSFGRVSSFVASILSPVSCVADGDRERRLAHAVPQRAARPTLEKFVAHKSFGIVGF
jgi:hypothetical protein